MKNLSLRFLKIFVLILPPLIIVSVFSLTNTIYISTPFEMHQQHNCRVAADCARLSSRLDGNARSKMEGCLDFEGRPFHYETLPQNSERLIVQSDSLDGYRDSEDDFKLTFDKKNQKVIACEQGPIPTPWSHHWAFYRDHVHFVGWPYLIGYLALLSIFFGYRLFRKHRGRIR